MKLTKKLLKTLVNKFGQIKLLVVGDFFLDKYFFLDRSLSEISLETGLEAYQAIEVRPIPGGAGTVAKDLAVLGAQTVALSVIGDDGEGLELVRALQAFGVNTGSLVCSSKWRTPTYIKPIMRESDGTLHELNRIDIKNRLPLPEELEKELILRMQQLIPEVDGVALVDQAGEYGVLTKNIIRLAQQLADAFPNKIFIADSRTRISLFRNVIIKPNYREAAIAVGIDPATLLKDSRALYRIGEALKKQTGKSLYITLGEAGIFLLTDQASACVPAVPVEGPIDPVGAGDAVMAGLLSALCAGADHIEAAEFAMLVAGITIQKLWTTGEATPAEIFSLYAKYKNMFKKHNNFQKQKIEKDHLSD